MTELVARRRLLYGRRKGPKLSSHQKQLRTELLPGLTLNLEAGRDPRSYFSRAVDDVWLEVGFGGGEHLVWQVEHHTNIGMLGAEPYESGVAKLLSKLERSLIERNPPTQFPSWPGGAERSGARPGHPSTPASAVMDGPRALRLCYAPVGHDDLGVGSIQSEDVRAGDEGGAALVAVANRVRIHEGDARDIIEALPGASLGRVFILFPDPWPKKRHHKRRFVQVDMLDRLARVMRAGAELRFATDDSGYLVWTLERITAHPAFLWEAKRALDWTTRPADWPATRYEAKALHGPPAYLRFRRI